MEAGYPETWGTETAHPKPKQPEHPTARPTWNTATSPAGKKNPAPARLPALHPSHWNGRTVENLQAK